MPPIQFRCTARGRQVHVERADGARACAAVGGTFGGNMVAGRVSSAVLDVLWEE